MPRKPLECDVGDATWVRVRVSVDATEAFERDGAGATCGGGERGSQDDTSRQTRLGFADPERRARIEPIPAEPENEGAQHLG